jgi:hypothetical protein
MVVYFGLGADVQETMLWYADKQGVKSDRW